MSRQYYFLVAGFPDLLYDDNKIPFSLKELISYLSEHLPEKDLNLLKLYFWRFDNENILLRLKDPEAEINTLGNLDSTEIEELIRSVTDGSFDQSGLNAPDYIRKLIEAFKEDKPLISNKSWDLQFTELYYDYVSSADNKFISSWFIYERDLNNLLTAHKCRENSMEVDKQLIGRSEITEKLARSTTRDFGLSDEIPNLEQFIKALDETDALDQERKIDLIKWNYIDEESFFYYFTIERIFTFLIKLAITDRWIRLDKETGKELFKKLLKELEDSYEFPKDFSLN